MPWEELVSSCVLSPCSANIPKKCLLKNACLFESTVETKNSWIVILLLPPSYYKYNPHNKSVSQQKTLSFDLYMDIIVLPSSPVISNSVNSKSLLFQTKIQFPWIYMYPHVSRHLRSAISNSVISNSPATANSSFFPNALNQPRYFELVKNRVSTKKHSWKCIAFYLSLCCVMNDLTI